MAGHQDLFEDVLNLEDQYYQEGYDLGVADGSKSGRIEGRLFGLEKGYEKFVDMGRLHGKASVWKARLEKSVEAAEDASRQSTPLRKNGRLEKHVQRLAALSDPDDLSTDNNEDAVSDFDDRMKDAKAKATLIARIVGEDEVVAPMEDESVTQAAAESGAPLRVRRTDPNSAPRRTGEMEDFAGLPTMPR